MAKPSTTTLHYLSVTGSSDSLVKLMLKIIFFQKYVEIPGCFGSQNLSPAITGDHTMGFLFVQSSPEDTQPFLLYISKHFMKAVNHYNYIYKTYLNNNKLQ